MKTDILITGVGGQGIVLASKLLAACAMEKGLNVMSAETIGMAQKGGSVFSFLRIGEHILCPMFAEKTADIIIGFEPAETVRMLGVLKNGGSVVMNTHPIMPVTAALSGGSYSGAEMTDYVRSKAENTVLVDGGEACRSLGSPKVLNMVMLGAVSGNGLLPFTADEIEAVMRKTVKPAFAELNAKALHYTGNPKK